MNNKILNIEDFKKYNSGANKGRINWLDNIGIVAKVLYDNKIYEVTIIDFITKDSKVVFSYLNKVQKPMFCGHFIDCKFGKVFKDKVYLKDKIKETNYDIDYERCQSELNLSKEVIDNFTYGTKTKIFVKCKKCGMSKKNMVVFLNIYNRNMKCEFCSNGLSYPERYFLKVMESLNEKYIKTKFCWSNNREYDGYFDKYNLCVELNGIQHYEKGFDTIGGKDVEHEKGNDRYKKHLAKLNGIKNYITIDCRYSNPNYIRKNIIKSLSWLFDFNAIDWDTISLECENSIVLDVCNMWNSLNKNNRSTTLLSKHFDISVDSIRNYLKKGTEQNWTKYNPKEETTRTALISNAKKRKRVRCITTGEEYNSLMDIERKLNIPCSNISKCCNPKDRLKTAGGYEWEFCK